MKDLLSIAADVEGEYWKEEHFLLDLADKWKLSWVVLIHERPIAYAILSRKGPAHAHIHHFMIAAPYRSQGLGKHILDMVMRQATKLGCDMFTLKVRNNDEVAKRLYAAFGFRVEGPDGEYLRLEKKL